MDKPQPAPTANPLIGWTAGYISDPVLRLRFLRAVAPTWQPKNAAASKFSWTRRAALSLLAASLLLAAGLSAVTRRTLKASKQAPAVTLQVDAPAIASLPAGMALPDPGAAQEIWQVEKTAAFETYSNGLRIDNKFTTANHPRSYVAFVASASVDTAGQSRSSPAGIVYHTTESLQAPFEPDQNGKLMKVGEALLDFVKRKKAYNFVVDRFGRVFRVVEEGDAAEHAGYSVWAGDESLYVNLNESFLGVAVETQTQQGQTKATVTSAQIRATAMLTEMLRSRYRIPAGNCVTHGQVSVNPSRMLAGYHMDWASSFPFEEIGLPDNYARPLPSIAAFGFECDASYSRAAGARLSDGAGLAAQELTTRAAAAGMSVPAYRKALQKDYRKRLAATRGAAVTHEGD